VKKGYVSQDYSVAKEGRNIEEGSKKSRFSTAVVVSFFSLSLILSISIVAFSLVFFVSSVKGGSMMQTLNAYHSSSNPVSDSVLVNKFKTPARGNIIVVRYYWNPSRFPDESLRILEAKHRDSRGAYDYFIKRLIALEGDVVEIKRDETNRWRIYVNGTRQLESYLSPDPTIGTMTGYGDMLHNSINNPHSRWATTVCGIRVIQDGKIIVPPGHMFYMGDNRGNSGLTMNSYDSASFGPQPIDFLEGVVVDTIEDGKGVGAYIWEKFVHFITFRWI
jgi:signal peptidase I